jgi:LPXTG-motif cell wall-anchored protein
MILILSLSLVLIPYSTFAVSSYQVDKPVILSIDHIIEQVSEGTQITLTIRAKSSSPVDWINMTLDGPTKNIFGGGGGEEFKEVSPQIWEYKRTDLISKYAPSGTYKYSRISVENKGEMKSDDWQDININIQNSIEPQKPSIISVDAEIVENSEGTQMTLTIRAKSNSPVDWINMTLDGPTKNIFGGGGGEKFKEVSPKIWEYKRTDLISKYAPSGIYKYSGISVENKGEMKSDDWQDININIQNSIEPQKPSIISVDTETVENSEGTQIILTIRAKSNSPVDWINMTLDGPTKNIFGGGGGEEFKEVSPQIWEYKRTDLISKYAPSGTYKYSRISVENKGEIKSDEWADINIKLSNNIIIAEPKGNLYNKTQKVILTSSKDGVIYYTIDGSEPTESSFRYDGSINIDKSTTLKFIGIDMSGTPSKVYTEEYVIDMITPTVYASPRGDTYESTQTIVLTQSEEGNIYYTLDGSDPTEASKKYSKPIDISKTASLKFIGVDKAGNKSPVYTEQYIINSIVNVISVSLNKTSSSLVIGETDSLVATVNPSNANNKNVTWSSNDASVATVDSRGKVTAVGTGNAVITVTTEDGSKTATYNVIVKKDDSSVLPKTGSIINAANLIFIGLAMFLLGIVILKQTRSVSSKR